MSVMPNLLSSFEERSGSNQRLQINRVDNLKELSYYLFLPDSLSDKSKIMVCVHGISFNAKEQITTFSERANKHNYIIVAPCFYKKYYKGYQRLETGAAGYTPAIALDKMLQDVEDKHGVDTQIFSLFGYSGGAQFSHRYAMFYPERISRLIVSSAGWFTFPDEEKIYPYGLKNTPDFSSTIKNKLAKFLQLPIHVIIGELDNIQDDGLNKRKLINRQQGYHRLDRAKNWVDALQSQSKAMSLKSCIRFIIIKGCGHSFENCERLGDLGKYIFTSDH